MDAFWQQSLETIRGRLNQVEFDNWVAPLEFLGFEDQSSAGGARVLCLGAPHRDFASWVIQHFLPTIQSAAVEVANEPLRVEIAVGTAVATSVPSAARRQVGSGAMASSAALPPASSSQTREPGGFTNGALAEVRPAGPEGSPQPLTASGNDREMRGPFSGAPNADSPSSHGPESATMSDEGQPYPGTPSTQLPFDFVPSEGRSSSADNNHAESSRAARVHPAMTQATAPAMVPTVAPTVAPAMAPAAAPPNSTAPASPTGPALVPGLPPGGFDGDAAGHSGQGGQGSGGRVVVSDARGVPPGFDLNPEYTFDNFVVGDSNRFCQAACRAVAERPARSFNPLFVYGGTGLGKTHLLHAIGNSIRSRYPAYRIKYISSETYINELIQCIRLDRMDEFRFRYRSECDVLLVDDIQFFGGKDRTQHEFFHTFNSLYGSYKQIVLTSDRAPSEVPELEERLRTRFEWGLIADVQRPEVETRVAILESKAARDDIQLPEGVAMFLATHIKSNVRILEGSLIRLKAYATLTGSELSVDMAKQVLGDVLQSKSRVVTVEQIAKAVAAYHQVKLADLRGPRRLKVITRPRMIAMYLARDLTNDSFPEIGRWFGGRDHSTVINAVNKIRQLLETDLQLQRIVKELKTQLQR